VEDTDDEPVCNKMEPFPSIAVCNAILPFEAVNSFIELPSLPIPRPELMLTEPPSSPEPAVVILEPPVPIKAEDVDPAAKIISPELPDTDLPVDKTMFPAEFKVESPVDNNISPD